MTSLQPQTRFRFAALFTDPLQDPARGNNAFINRLFCANGTTSADPSQIKNQISNCTLRGPGFPVLLYQVNGNIRPFYIPLVHQPSLGALGSPYQDKLLALDGDLMGEANLSFSAVELPLDVFHKTSFHVTLKPDQMSAHYTADSTSSGVGPFAVDQAGDDDKEKIKSRFCGYQPHDLGDLMNPPGGLTVSYFWVTVYPVIVSEGKKDVYEHLIQFFQLAATLVSAGGDAVTNKSHPPTIQRDEGVYENFENVINRIFPRTAGSSDSQQGLKEVATSIADLAAGQQRQAEEAEERRKKKEAEKFSLEKQLGRQFLSRLLNYNGCSSEAELKRMGIPFVDGLVKLESDKESDVFEVLQESLERVYTREGVALEGRTVVPPQLLKALMQPWDRYDPDSLTTGFGSNLFLHGPRDRAKSTEAAELFKTTFFANNAPDADVLKKLYGGEVYVPTIGDIGVTIRGMLRLMKTVLRPGHPHLQSLQKVLDKWVDAERDFTLAANGDNDPARGIYFLEALNMLMNAYWREQRTSDYLIPGWDGDSLFTVMNSKQPWKPVFTPRYRSALKVDLFQGVFGAHKIVVVGESAVVNVTPSQVPQPPTPSYNPAPTRVAERVVNDVSKPPGGQVKNERYSLVLFGRFKSRQDPVTKKEYRTADVRQKETEFPLPASKSGTGKMCLAYHSKGMCNLSCPRAADHISYSDEEYKPLVQWCDKCYPGSDE